MTKKNNSSKSRNSLKKAEPKFGRDLVKSAKLILADVKGEIRLPSYTISSPLDVKAIRQRSGLSQAKFAQSFGLSFRTLQEWEQGKSVPDGPARSFLRVIDRNPEAVRQALAN